MGKWERTWSRNIHLKRWIKYVGEYKDGERNGHGTFTSFEGDKYVGEFKDEKFWNGTTYEIGGNIFGKWVNGKLEVKYPPIPINKL